MNHENSGAVPALDALRPKGKLVQAVCLTSNIHEAMFIASVSGVPPLPQDSGKNMPNGFPKVVWGFASTPLVDEAMALWRIAGTPGLGPVKDWDDMTREERKAVVNVVSATLSFQNQLIADMRVIAASRGKR